MIERIFFFFCLNLVSNFLLDHGIPDLLFFLPTDFDMTCFGSKIGGNCTVSGVPDFICNNGWRIMLCNIFCIKGE